MRIGIVIAAGVAAVALGVGYRYGDVIWAQYGAPLWQRYAGAPADTPDRTASEERFAVPVEAVSATVERLELTIPAVGSLRSNESVVLSPEIAGRIIELGIEEGKRVAAGTVIARLDQSVYVAEIAEIKANLDLSRANFKRADELFRKKAGTARARDEAEAVLRVNEAKLELATARLDKMVITAPFDGVLGLRSVSVGQYLAPGTAIVSLDSINPLKVDFRVPEVYFTRVKVGQVIKVGVDALAGSALDGTVYAIDPVVDAQGRAFLVRAAIPNDDGSLRPGLFARVSLVYDSIDDAIMVPEQALVPMGADKFLFRVVEGKAVLTKVVLGERVKGRVQIREGVAVGDTVVTAGQLKIVDGDEVTVIPPLGNGAGGA